MAECYANRQMPSFITPVSHISTASFFCSQLQRAAETIDRRMRLSNQELQIRFDSAPNCLSHFWSGQKRSALSSLTWKYSEVWWDGGFQRCVCRRLAGNMKVMQCVSIHYRTTVSVKSEPVPRVPRPECSAPVIWHIPAPFSRSNGQLKHSESHAKSFLSAGQSQDSL